MKIEQHISNSEEDTISLGRKFAEKLKFGDAVAFTGDLGAGKTEFIKGICDYFAVKEIVSSPTFTIMNQYKGLSNSKELTIYHIDLYRINKKEDLEEIGFSECMHADEAIKLVEWAEKAENFFPKVGYMVKINTSETDEDLREINITKED